WWVGRARCAVRAACSGAMVPPADARARTSQRDVPTYENQDLINVPHAERYLMNENQKHAGRPWQIPPLISRELLVYSRRPWTYWLRLLSALGAVSVLALTAASGQNRL